MKEKELIINYVNPQEPIGPGLGHIIWKSKEELLNQFPDQPERSKREDLIRYKLCCPECNFQWEQDIDMRDFTDGISPCLKCGYP